jgi:uncharacterized protein DUF2249
LVPIYRLGAPERSFAVHHDHARPADGSRIWRTADAVHIDLRGLESPEPMVTVLQTIESGDVDTALVGHFDQEPIFLYPELEERGWNHETVESHCGDCEGGFMLRMVRWGK